MRISELIVEDQNIEEISLGGVARGIGKVAGAVGSVPGVAAGAWQAAKSGYQAGKAAVLQPKDTTTEPQGGTVPTATTSPTSGVAPIVQQPATVTISQSDYMQVKNLLGKLNNTGKRRILSKLQKDLGMASPAAPSMTAVVGGKSKKTAVPESVFYSNFLRTDI